MIAGRLVRNEMLSLTIGGRMKASTNTIHATVDISTVNAASTRGTPLLVSLLTMGLSALININAKKRVKNKLSHNP
ncbi:MAG: hypothetical protein UZ22_OP11002000963 [Microgenomates bacterium OLB23]|nr:MAG: hypothetical protein UZ22_OP11002000963 [Microgenomates bacterium OLB23]